MIKFAEKFIIYIAMLLVILFVLATIFTSQLLVAYASEESEQHTAEVIYNELHYKSGEIKYTIQAWVNKDKILANTPQSLDLEVGTQIDETLEKLKDDCIQSGLDATYNSEQNLVEITLGTYASAHIRAVLDPESNGYEPYDPFEGLETWGFYKSTYSWTFDTVFKDTEDTYLETAILALDSINTVDSTNLIYIYNYGTSTSNKTIFSNSDNYYYNTKHELYIHEFLMTSSTASSKQITLSQNVYNSLGWNLTLIVITLCVIVAFVVIKKKKEGENNKKDSLTIDIKREESNS